jgi:hypothetical protein
MIRDGLAPQAVNRVLAARLARAPTQTGGDPHHGLEQLRRRLYERRWGIMGPTPATSATGDG